MALNWQQVDDFTRRAKIYGGWLVQAHEPVVHDTADRGMSDGWDFRIAMCFVPDAEHLWEVVEKFTGDGK